MQRKSRLRLTTRPRGIAARILSVFLLAVVLISPHAVLAADTECGTATPINTSLCIPAIGPNDKFNINGADGEWTTGTFLDHSEFVGGGSQEARVRVSRKPTGFDATGIAKTDLFLFFDVKEESGVANELDDIRIGLNPGTDPAKSTLLKIQAFPSGGGPPIGKRFVFDGVQTWSQAGPNNESWYQVATLHNAGASTWTAEVRISLDQIPTNPITGTSFRLFLNLMAHNGIDFVDYRWPQTNASTTHNFICAQSASWQPMSLPTTAGDCRNPDVSIANGLYSCDAIYILRNGVKSREIATGQSNEFHADVTNPGPGTANDVVVFFTLMKLGISTGPIAMNYSHTDNTIVNFFNTHFGSWMAATDSLSTGTPRPPTPFSINAATTNTAARFNWRPSDEGNVHFGPVAGFVDSHRCTAAFVNFKDDPNFNNNFSYCNTAIVSCPTGQICLRKITVGPIYPFIEPREDFRVRLKVSKFNEAALLRGGGIQVRIQGQNLAPGREGVFELTVPQKGEVPLDVSIINTQGTKDGPPVEGGTNPATPARITGDPIQDRDARLKQVYGDKPIVIIEGLVQTSSVKTPDGKDTAVYAPISYVAFVVSEGPEGGPGSEASPTPPVDKGCGTGTSRGYIIAILVVILALIFIWLVARRRKKEKAK